MESTPHHTFYKRTRKGKVVKIVREKYLRDDLDAGYLHGKKIDRLLLQELVTASDHKTLLVIDTNIALHQIDALEYACPVMSLIVIPQTVLQELKHLNLAIYKRLFALFSCENKNYVLFPNEMCQQTAIQRCARYL